MTGCRRHARGAARRAGALGRAVSGRDWIGVRMTEASLLTGVDRLLLFNGFLGLAILLGLAAAMSVSRGTLNQSARRAIPARAFERALDERDRRARGAGSAGAGSVMR